MGRMDEALKRAEGETSKFTLPVASPESPAPNTFESPWSFAADEAAEPASEAPTSVTDPDSPPPRRPATRFALLAATPAMAEQYRRLAAALHHAQTTQGTRLVMVASAEASDGKSLTAANLALTLSESYRRNVLLIDADLRRPTLHTLFGAPNVCGLNDGLHAGRDGKLAVQKLTDTLTLLPAGRPDPDPMSTLTSPRMAKILSESAERFDWVLIDTPPLGFLADAHLLSTQLDGVVLVVRANKTAYATVAKAVDALGRERILGVVLNAATNLSATDYSYHYKAEAESSTDSAPPEA